MARDYAETLRALQVKADDPSIPEAERNAFLARIELFKTKVNEANKYIQESDDIWKLDERIFRFNGPDVDSIYEEVFKYGDIEWLVVSLA